MDKLRLGIIGCGVIGSGAHLPAAAGSDAVETVAVADLIDERVRAAAEKWSVPRAYASGAELLADPDVEAVALAVPAGVRHALAMAALQHGKHVLIEKPVAQNVAQVEAMLAARGDRVVGCCSSRFVMLPSTRAAAECVASGVLGPLRVVRIRALLPAGPPPSSPPPPWRVSHALNGGGILVNWGCYDLDYVMAVTGWTLRPRTVFAQTWPLAPKLSARVDPCSDADNHFIALIRCEGGTMLSFERGEFVSAGRDEAWQILGQDATLQLWLHGGKNKRLTLDESFADRGVESRPVWQGDDEGDVTRALHEDFARAIRGGGQPQTSLERALIMQRITDAIYESARTGRAVDL
jgi:predicted dehydrogenase